MQPKSEDLDGAPLDLDGVPIDDLDGELLDPELARRRREREQRHRERDLRERRYLMLVYYYTHTVCLLFQNSKQVLCNGHTLTTFSHFAETLTSMVLLWTRM